jgi:hypothetical protein
MDNVFTDKIIENKKIKEEIIAGGVNIVMESDFMKNISQSLINDGDFTPREVINIFKEIFARCIKEMRIENKISVVKGKPKKPKKPKDLPIKPIKSIEEKKDLD